MFATLERNWSWVVLAASFSNQFISLGFPFCLGIYNVEFLEAFGDTKANTAWISSIHIAFVLGAGPVVAYVMDRTSLRIIACLGAIVSAAGAILTIFATKLFHLYITIGVIMGSGFCMIYFPSAVLVGLYFTKNRTFATALSACGAAIGMVIFPVIQTSIIETYTWRGSLYIIAGLCTQTLVFSALLRPINQMQNIEKEFESISEIQRDFEMKHADDLSNSDVILRDISGKQSDDVLSKDDESGNKRESTNASCDQTDVEHLKKTNSININNNVNTSVSNDIITRSDEMRPVPFKTINGELSENQDVDRKYILTSNRDTDIRHSEITYGNVVVKDLQNVFDGSDLANQEECMVIVEPHNVRVIKRKITRNRRFRLGRIMCKCVALKCKLQQNIMLESSFLIYIINNVMWNLGTGIVFVIAPDYLYVTGADKSQFYILMLMVGVGSVVGGTLFAFIVKWKSNYLVSMYCGMCLTCGVASALFAVTADIGVIGVLAFVVGLTYGTIASWLLAIVADLIGISKLSEGYGYVMLANGIGNLTGPPLGGWLYDVTGNYSATFWIAGSLVFGSGVLMAVIPLKQRYARRPNTQLKSKSLSNSNSQRCSEYFFPFPDHNADVYLH